MCRNNDKICRKCVEKDMLTHVPTYQLVEWILSFFFSLTRNFWTIFTTIRFLKNDGGDN